MKERFISVIALLLLAASLPSIRAYDITVDTASYTVDDMSAEALREIRNSAGIKMVEILQSLTVLPANLTDSMGRLPEFINTFLTLSTKYVNKEEGIPVQFLLFTSGDPSEVEQLELSLESLQASTFDPSLETKFLIHGFPPELTEQSVMFNIKDRMFQKGDYNIIIVNWTRHKVFPYYTAVVEALYVGFEISKLIHFLMIFTGISPRTVHLIGHSVGGHSAGFAGKLIPNIGRITGLDVAGPLFDDLPEALKLTDTDAEFVDAIHTGGALRLDEGYGTLMPIGDVDFFPNGGRLQPGCDIGDLYFDTNVNFITVQNQHDKSMCNHNRALYLFLESIDGCRFESLPFSCYKNKVCSHEAIRMGFHAKPDTSLPPHSKFYIETKDDFPYCMDTS